MFSPALLDREQFPFSGLRLAFRLSLATEGVWEFWCDSANNFRPNKLFLSRDFNLRFGGIWGGGLTTEIARKAVVRFYQRFPKPTNLVFRTVISRNRKNGSKTQQ